MAAINAHTEGGIEHSEVGQKRGPQHENWAFLTHPCFFCLQNTPWWIESSRVAMNDAGLQGLPSDLCVPEKEAVVLKRPSAFLTKGWWDRSTYIHKGRG